VRDNKYPRKQFINKTRIFDGQGLKVMCHSSVDRPASIHEQQKTMLMDDKLFTGWVFNALP
jgi:hypothetical protein